MRSHDPDDAAQFVEQEIHLPVVALVFRQLLADVDQIVDGDDNVDEQMNQTDDSDTATV